MARLIEDKIIDGFDREGPRFILWSADLAELVNAVRQDERKNAIQLVVRRHGRPQDWENIVQEIGSGVRYNPEDWTDIDSTWDYTDGVIEAAMKGG